MLTPALALPPLFTAVRLRELGDAFAHAKTIAAESGAGTLVHVGRFDLAEFALVLEPEEPLRGARRAFYAGMTALTDALIGTAEPETAIAIAWPDAIRVNLGLVGGGRLAWPAGASEDEVPPWLVFGAMIRVQSMTGQEPGVNPQVTALAEEGFIEVTTNEIVESFARHFMVAIDAWQESGFGAVAQGLPAAPRRAKKACAATSTRMAICWCAAPAATRSSAARLLRRSRRRPGSIRQPGSRWHEAVAQHQARSVGHFRVRQGGGAGRVGGVRRLRLLGRRPDHAHRQGARAFRSGFLGVESLGRSTLVQIVAASEADRAAVVDRLAQRLVEHYGAPDMNAAARRRRRKSPSRSRCARSRRIR